MPILMRRTVRSRIDSVKRSSNSMVLGLVDRLILCLVVRRWRMELLAFLEEGPVVESKHTSAAIAHEGTLTANHQTTNRHFPEPPTHHSLPDTHDSRS